jgi:hypothetical protein
LRLTKKGNGWQIEWQTHKATHEKLIAEARQVMIAAWQEAGFTAGEVEEMAILAFGQPYDRHGTITL